MEHVNTRMFKVREYGSIHATHAAVSDYIHSLVACDDFEIIPIRKVGGSIYMLRVDVIVRQLSADDMEWLMVG